MNPLPIPPTFMVVSTGKWDLPSPTSLAADLEALTNQISTHFDAIMFLNEGNLNRNDLQAAQEHLSYQT